MIFLAPLLFALTVADVRENAPDDEALPSDIVDLDDAGMDDLDLKPDLMGGDEPEDQRQLHTDPESGLTDDQAMGLGVGAGCCCLISVVGIGGLIFWLVRRGRVAQTTPSQAVGPGIAPPVGGMQLSIFALALEPQARAAVEAHLASLGVFPVPTTPQTRGSLVREAARALLGVETSWRQFGFGEKPNLADLASAEHSYRAASEDFRSRALSVGTTAGAEGRVVVTVLVCSRRPLLAVSRLDDARQVRDVLEARLNVSDADLLGAELLWAPLNPGGTVSDAELALRFPEMVPLAVPPIS